MSMRACLFSASLDALTREDWARRLNPKFGGEDVDVIRLTNSWADLPPDPDLHATGGGRAWGMRALRRATQRGSAFAQLTAHLLKHRVASDLLEGLRAADPDIIICDTSATAAQLRIVLRAEHAPWPCISVTEQLPAIDRSFRRYDPAVKVSIVLPSYNGVRYLRDSIISCLRQTHRNVELIIVDDGSTAPVETIVREFSDSRIRFIRHQQNQGLPASLNTGFSASTGEFCTWTSDDNAYVPSAIQPMVAFLQTYRGVDFVYADSFRIDESGVLDPQDVIKTRPPEALLQDNYIGACFLYTRDVYTTIGDYDRAAVLAEDYDYWVRVSEHFTMQRLFERLYCYRFHASSLTARVDRADVERQVRRIQRTRRRGGVPALAKAAVSSFRRPSQEL